MIECCCSVCVCVSENCLTFNSLQIFRFCSGHKCLRILPKAVLWWEDGWVRGNVLWLVWIGTSWKPTVSLHVSNAVYLSARWYFCVERLSTPGLGLIKQQWRVEVYMACFTGLGVLSLTAQNNMNLGPGLARNAGPTWPLWLDNTSKDLRIIWSPL